MMAQLVAWKIATPWNAKNLERGAIWLWQRERQACKAQQAPIVVCLSEETCATPNTCTGAFPHLHWSIPTLHWRVATLLIQD